MTSRLLLLLTEDVDIPARRVSNVRSVVASAVLAQLGHLGDFLGSELHLLEVLLDAGRRHRLGDDTVAADLGPGQDDLGRGDGGAEALGGGLSDFLDFGAGDEEGDAEAVVAEGLFIMLVSMLMKGVEVGVLQSRRSRGCPSSGSIR